MTMKEQERVRLHLAVTRHVADRLEAVRKLTEAESATEVFRRALACYEDMAEIYCNGGRIVLHPREGEPREMAPVWPRARESSV